MHFTHIFTLIGFLFFTFCSNSKGDVDEKAVEISTFNYGCLHKPPYSACSPVRDPHCRVSQVLRDLCWSNVFWECDTANQQLVPKVCSFPLVYKTTGGGACQYAKKKKRDLTELVNVVGSQNITRTTCSCASYCNTPPTCPTISNPDDCKNAVLIRHVCDCQFFWRCPYPSGPAQLSVCNNGYYFKQTSLTPYPTGQCVLATPGQAPNTCQ